MCFWSLLPYTCFSWDPLLYVQGLTPSNILCRIPERAVAHADENAQLEVLLICFPFPFQHYEVFFRPSYQAMRARNVLSISWFVWYESCLSSKKQRKVAAWSQALNWIILIVITFSGTLVHSPACLWCFSFPLRNFLKLICIELAHSLCFLVSHFKDSALMLVIIG